MFEADLPERYAEIWPQSFYDNALAAIRPDSKILDMGSGRRPAFSRDMLPPGAHYAGFDLSARELLAAPGGSYDDVIECDISARQENLAGRYDVVVSWCVLEHVKDLAASLENVRLYLKPGGVFVAMFSGSFSAFGVINRLLPVNVGRWFLKTLLNRDLDKVFPAYYDSCYYSKLLEITRPWSDVTVVPRYRGASYFQFSRPIQRVYLAYENYICANGYKNMATHYLIVLKK